MRFLTSSGDFDHQQLDAHFEEVVLPNYQHLIGHLKNKKLILVSAQPGGGKSTISGRFIAELGGDKGVLRVDADTFRKYHTDYKDLCQADILAMTETTGRYAFEMRRRIFERAIATDSPVVLENTLIYPDRVFDMLRGFHQAGYEIDFHALAVHSRTSLKGIVERFVKEEAPDPKTGRWVPLKDHRMSYEHIPDNLDIMAQSGMITNIALHSRTDMLFAQNLKTEGVPPTGQLKSILEAERQSKWDADKRRLHKQDWDSIWGMMLNASHIQGEARRIAGVMREEAMLLAQAQPSEPADDRCEGVVKAVTPHNIFVEFERGLVSCEIKAWSSPNILAGERWYPRTPDRGYPRRQLGRAAPAGGYKF